MNLGDLIGSAVTLLFWIGIPAALVWLLWREERAYRRDHPSPRRRARL